MLEKENRINPGHNGKQLVRAALLSKHGNDLDEINRIIQKIDAVLYTGDHVPLTDKEIKLSREAVLEYENKDAFHPPAYKSIKENTLKELSS